MSLQLVADVMNRLYTSNRMLWLWNFALGIEKCVQVCIEALHPLHCIRNRYCLLRQRLDQWLMGSYINKHTAFEQLEWCNTHYLDYSLEYYEFFQNPWQCCFVTDFAEMLDKIIATTKKSRKMITFLVCKWSASMLINEFDCHFKIANQTVK